MSETTNILVVDDEKEIAELVEIYLVSDGYKVFKANNAMDGLDILDKNEIHLVLLDIMMPGMDGMEMCRKIRETNNIPIIMLSAKSTDLDKIMGLGTGADDYVTKPFNPLELTARVKSQLRRYTQLNPNSAVNEKAGNEITIRGLIINKDNHKVTVYGEEIKLTPIEFDILYLLASNPGRVFSTDEIFEKVWNEKVYEANNTVMVHIRRLRGKMKEDTRQNKIITTVWGVGYKIENDMNRRFRTRVITNIFYSAVVTVLIEVFLVTNVSLIATYMDNAGIDNFFISILVSFDVVVILMYVLFGILVFTVTFMILQEKSLRYITKISDAMQNISEGDLNVTVEVEGDDEFSSMAANLNKMVEDLKELMDKERESERTKNELITNVAHDLRTPLTSIIGYLELLSGDVKLEPEIQKKYINIAYVKTKRLEKLIEDLFGFTKMNYGKLSMHVGQVDVVKLLSQLLEEFYPSFVDKNLSYELQSNVPVKVITADGNLLARLFDNLINNAIKYGADGKRIMVKLHADDEIVTVSVINYGYVIPADELPLIFNKFYRVEQSRSTNTGGTGLGLAISKNIVDMHGGTITVTSDLSGTVFTVKLKVNFDINKENFGKIG